MSSTDGRRGRGQSSQFRNIPLTPEIVSMGFTDIQVQAQNMVLRHQDGLMLIAKYDMKDLTKTARLLESQLAEYVGKPQGLPEGFNPKSFAAMLSITLMRDIQDQFAQKQEQIQEEEKRVNSVLDEIKELRDDNADISFEQWQATLVSKYDNLKDVVDKKLSKIWSALEFGLSSLRILNIDDCTLPLIGILLGRPGSGKTVVISLLSKWLYGYYTDDFSPKAWVSHTTSVNSEEELEAIDMLPKIKDRQFLTPELATLFNLKEDDLRVALSKITRIADGHGFASDSGVYGHRAYGHTMFTWLGGVVDIPHHVYKVMAHLGPRLYFFRLPFKEITPTELLSNLTGNEKFNAKYKAIEEALFDYLKWFEIGPTVLPRTPNSPHLRKVQWDSSNDNLDAMQCIVNLTVLLGHLRREGAAYMPDRAMTMTDPEATEDEGYSYFVGAMEDITRASEVLTNIARGHALITGRNYITMEDIPIVVKTVLSTARVERIKAFIALLDNDGTISKKELANQLHISRSTAYRFMTELMAIGLVNIELTNDMEYTENDHPAKVKVMYLKRDKFSWFLGDEFKQLRDNFTPVDNRKYMQDTDPEKEAVRRAAGISSGPESTLDDINEKKREGIKSYEAAQAKIRADAARARRDFDREIRGGSGGASNNESGLSPPPGGSGGK